jgi:hypothetical protein
MSQSSTPDVATLIKKRLKFSGGMVISMVVLGLLAWKKVLVKMNRFHSKALYPPKVSSCRY